MFPLLSLGCKVSILITQSGRKRQNEHQYQKSGKRRKPTLELEETIQAARRKFYMGGGVGGPVANVPPSFVEP